MDFMFCHAKEVWLGVLEELIDVRCLVDTTLATLHSLLLLCRNQKQPTAERCHSMYNQIYDYASV